MNQVYKLIIPLETTYAIFEFVYFIFKMIPVNESLTTPQLELQTLSHNGGEDALTVGTHFQEVHRQMVLKDLHFLRKLVIKSKQ
jgi:hypothetical protein